MSGQRVGKYEVRSLIAKGARAATYRGVDPDTQRPVALKLIPRAHLNAAALPAFRKSMEALSRVDHPGLAACIDVVESEKAVCLVAGLAEGQPLSALLKEGARPELRDVWGIACAMLEALAFAHAKGVVHGDLKPANILVLADGSLRITDFGAASLLAGPPEDVRYRSPEHFTGEPVNARSDLYQAGAIVYHLVSGRVPFTGTPAEIEHRVHEERPTDPSSYDKHIAWQLDWVIQKALSKDPAERFGTAIEFAEGLRLGLQDSIGRPIDPIGTAKPAPAASAAAPGAAPAKPETSMPSALARNAQAVAKMVAKPAAPGPAAPATPAPGAPAADAADTRPAVLFVDDDARILNALRALFRQEYRVFTAEGGEAALAILAAERIHVLVSDQRMPNMTGVELLRKACTAAPAAVRVLLTGYTDLAALVGSINQGEIFRFVCKPWDNDELRKSLAEAVEAAMQREGEPRVAPVSPRSAGSLLVIDANEGLGRGLERLLAGAAKVRLATTPEAAAKILQDEEVAAIVADMGAGMDGLVALFKQVKAKRPGILTILLADEPDSELGIELVNKAQVFRFLPKPVSARELRMEVATALRRYAAFKQVAASRAAAAVAPASGVPKDSGPGRHEPVASGA